MGELRQLRQEQADSCAAMLYRLTGIDQHASTTETAVGTVATATSPLHADIVAVQTKLNEVRDAVLPVNGSLTSFAAANHTDLGSLNGTSATAASNTDSSGSALHSDLWFIAGVAAAALAGYGIYRQVMPRA